MRFSVDPKRVSHERLQDEVIIINMASGAYYSGSGTAADLWTLIAQGASTAEAASILAAAYRSEGSTVLRDVEACTTRLLERGIITPADDEAHLTNPMVPIEPAARAWAAPTFDEYTDMWDLIQLDPIHDFDDAGWPHAPTA